MPTLVGVFANPLALFCLAAYSVPLLWEQLRPARKLPVVPWWEARALLAFVGYFLLSTYLPQWWNASLAQYRLLDSSGWPLWTQALAGLLMYEFCGYWWHRAMHRFNWLWRSFHQMHHSVERLDTYSAFWFSPLDMAGYTFVGSLALTLILGVNAEAITLVLYTTFFLALFQHANIRTPRWLGYLVQRPESHSRHHGKGIHRDNYADLPIFDLLFGTFHNPATHSDNGFYPGASSRIMDMLLWRDLNTEPVLTPGESCQQEKYSKS